MSCRLYKRKKRRLATALLGFESLEKRQMLAADVRITEFLAANDSGLLDGNGKTSDWIELLNVGDQSVNLTGWHLTDDATNLAKWTFPDTPAATLAPGQFMVLFASGDGVADAAGNLHADFTLAASGEYLGLVRPDATVVSEFPAPFPGQRADVSYGIDLNGDLRFFPSPSPGSPNPIGLQGFVEDTIFSVDRGYYSASFSVEVSSSTLGATIIYTTDGSEPSPINGTQVTAAADASPTASITVTTTTTLRAAAYKSGFIETNVDTQTYLFLDDVITQPDAPTGFPTAWGTAPSVDYEMDPQITANAAYTQELLDGLRDLPALSIASSVDGLFGVNGIYSDPLNLDLEIPVSAEYIVADGSSGFQIDAGLKIAGGASRNPNNSPKHSLSLRFRNDYGDAKLDYDLFDGSPVDRFNSLQLRAMYNNSWIHWNNDQRRRGTLIRDQFIRDSLIAAGQDDAGRGSYAHLYLNGLYWGVYNVHERHDSSHYAAHQGGDPGDYDALNGGTAIDGNADSFDALRAAAQAGDWAYIKQNLDVDNFIDWAIAQAYGGNADLKVDGNWRAAGGGPGGALWRMYAWDSERVLEGVTDKPPATITDATGMYDSLVQIPEFVIRFGDRLQAHLFHDGVFTPNATAARWNSRVDELSKAIVAESARWGDYRRDVHPRGATASLYERDVHWDNEHDRLATDFFPERTDFLISQYKGSGLLPAVTAPEYTIAGATQSGGVVPAGSELRMTASEGLIYYTTNGSDPRLEGGNVNPSALTYDPTNPSQSPLVLSDSVSIRARVLSDGIWSPVHVADFVVPQEPASASNLRITEVAYHPMTGGVEFIELQNITSGAAGVKIDLGSLTLSEGPSAPLVIPVTATLGPQEHALLVSDIDLFSATYPNVPADAVVGEFSGALSNGGERILLLDAGGNTLIDFSYDDGDPWPRWADGVGGTLVLKNPAVTPAAQSDKPYRWRGSTLPGGSPGATDAPPRGVVINEILAHTDSPAVDTIELHNTTASDIDLGGWFLSDSATDLLKFKIPDGTLVAAGGYVTFDENDFNPTPSTPGPNDFALSGSHGDSVWLVIGNESGTAVDEFVDHVDFGATFNGISVGRLPDASGRLVPLAAPSLGGPNITFATSDVVVTEVNYHPSDPAAAAVQIDPSIDANDLEFVELHNHLSASVDLGNWRLRGDSDFDFAVGELIAAGETLVLVKFDPADPLSSDRASAFRTHYGIDATVRLVGPMTSSFSNRYGLVKLQRPDMAPADEPTVLPHVLVDEVFYDDVSPWPAIADGAGDSLQRAFIDTLGNDAQSWRASSPTPGTVRIVPRLQSVEINDGQATRSVVTRIDVTFDSPVQVPPAAFQLTNVTTNTEVTGMDIAVVVGDGTQVTLTFSGGPSVIARSAGENSLASGAYQLRIHADQITASVGNAPLDHDVLFGDQASESLFRKFGDQDGNNRVDLFDFAVFRGAFASNTGDSNFRDDLDNNGDGVLDLFDFAAFRASFGT